ncbi:HD domain-containing protein [Glutamicibacter arilaitensis]|uniref:HD domain-containing protein n=1 Tax=Glutamicibacter arilaitensis TaxID=256701 RepID=A0A4Y8TW29_9MICC|nr:HD domain-containing protein [Glutamicibacter arilaitensis]TFH55872.1 HD domain-containing protein [Glutamicibacter arilaitensis]
MTKLEPGANHYGHDVSSKIGSAGPSLFEQYPLLAELWEDAKELLGVRSNDAHTLYSVSVAHQLLGHYPQADSHVVLPAMLLHDIGWSAVDSDLVLSAIAPGAGNAELVLQHEKEGARLARQILVGHGVAAEDIERILYIIDGHDSRKESTSIEDSLVKDADKLWRLTGHGLDTIMDWFGLTRMQAFTLVESRVCGHLFTEPAQCMAAGFIAVERANMLAQRLALEER